MDMNLTVSLKMTRRLKCKPFHVCNILKENGGHNFSRFNLKFVLLLGFLVKGGEIRHFSY